MKREPSTSRRAFLAAVAAAGTAGCSGLSGSGGETPTAQDSPSTPESATSKTATQPVTDPATTTQTTATATETDTPTSKQRTTTDTQTETPSDTPVETTTRETENHYPSYLSNDPTVLDVENAYKRTKFNEPEELREFLQKYDVPVDKGYRVLSADDGMEITHRASVIDDGDFKANMPFYGNYEGDSYTRGYTVQGQAVMRSLSRIIPDDNVIDGCIVGAIDDRKEEPEFVADIYVDDAFREAVDDKLNIFQRFSGENVEQADITPFKFDEAAPGVYRQTVRESETDVFREDNYGYQVIAASLSKEEMAQVASEEANTDTEDFFSLSISA